VAEVMAGLSHLVAGCLARAAADAEDIDDQVACGDAVRSARDICGLLSSRP
jgi:hypothetical protein